MIIEPCRTCGHQKTHASSDDFTIFLVVLYSLRRPLEEVHEEFPMFTGEQLQRLYGQSVKMRQSMLEALARPVVVCRSSVLPIPRKTLVEDGTAWQSIAIRCLEDG